MQTNKTKLISEISEAFTGVELGDGIGLSHADAIDAYADQQTRIACQQNDEKHHWSSISSDSLNKYYSSLSYFDGRGMQFHLPAFMIAEINGEYKFGMSFVLTHLSDHSKTQFGLLTKDQRKAVKLFLEYLLLNPNYEYEMPEITRAIENYWKD